MRRIKAIYLIPVFIVLLVGAAIGGYYALLSPQMEVVKKARADWEAKKNDCVSVEKDYVPALQDTVTASLKYYNDSHVFHAIQGRMPAFYNMKQKYANNQTEGLKIWYQTMGSGKLVRDLQAWSAKFGLSKKPEFTFDGTLGFEESLPDVKIVVVDFGEQTITALGYSDLVNQVSRKVGYGYCPLIFAPKDNKLFITVDRENRKFLPTRPVLTMSYTAKGYFMTQGWDPNPTADADNTKALDYISRAPLRETKARTTFDKVGPCPPILFVLQPKGLTPYQ